MEIADIVSLYVEVIQIALPFTITFWMCNMLVGTFLRAAFGGPLTFKSL